MKINKLQLMLNAIPIGMALLFNAPSFAKESSIGYVSPVSVSFSEFVDWTRTNAREGGYDYSQRSPIPNAVEKDEFAYAFTRIISPECLKSYVDSREKGDNSGRSVENLEPDFKDTLCPSQKGAMILNEYRNAFDKQDVNKDRLLTISDFPSKRVVILKNIYRE